MIAWLRLTQPPSWLPALSHRPWTLGERCDWRAAWTSAFIMLPQAVILATLAGLPPEAGLYASVFPVVVAALAGHSPRLLSGPNTALAVMISAALAPLATPFSVDYVKLALSLSILVGVIQVLASLCRLGRFFELLPPFLVQGVTLGVGLVIVTGQAPQVFGVLGVGGEAPWQSLWRIPAQVSHANWFAVSVAATTFAGGFVGARTPLGRRVPPLVIALASGCITALLFDLLFGSANADLERVGLISLTPIPLSAPEFAWDQLYQTKQLVKNAVAIAFVGTLQTVIIVQSLDGHSRKAANPNREMLAQGLANIVAAFTSGFAGSGSFNRSAAHVAAGAKTRFAALMSAAIMFLLGFGAAPVMARVPVAALAGTLLLIGVDLVRSALRQIGCLQSRRDRIQVGIVTVLTLLAGLETGLICAMFLAALVFVWRYPVPSALGQAPEPQDAERR